MIGFELLLTLADATYDVLQWACLDGYQPQGGKNTPFYLWCPLSSVNRMHDPASDIALLKRQMGGPMESHYAEVAHK